MKNKIVKIITIMICILWMTLGISINISNAVTLYEYDAVHMIVHSLWTKYIAIILIILIITLIIAIINKAIKKKSVKKLAIYTIVCVLILILMPTKRIHEVRWS